MTIKQTGGVFGRNPTFNDVTVEGDLTVDGTVVHTGDLTVDNINISGNTLSSTDTNGDINITPNGNGYTVTKRFKGTDYFEFRESTVGGSTVAYLVNDADPGTTAESVGIAFAPANNLGAVAQILAKRVGSYSSAGTRDSELQFYNSVNGVSTNQWTITNSGDLKAVNSGNGIDFSATAGTGTSELFDDYEEGTWTPVVADASAGGNTATGTFTGTYTKIGRMVTLNAVLVDINTSGMTSGNILYLRNLPFVTTTGHIGSNLMRSVTYSGQIAPRTLDGLSYLYFMEYSSGSATSVLTVGGISSGVADIWFTVTYEV